MISPAAPRCPPWADNGCPRDPPGTRYGIRREPRPKPPLQLLDGGALAHSFPPRAAEAAITENQAGGCTELAGKPLCWCIRSRSTRRQRKHCTEALTGKPIAVERSPCSILVWLEAL